MKLLKDLLGKNFVSTPVQKGIETAKILELTNSFFVHVFPQAHPTPATGAYIKLDTLTIACKNTVVPQEVMLHEQELLDYIRQYTGNNTIKRIKCTLEQGVSDE
jgi:hypothetical protein